MIGKPLVGKTLSSKFQVTIFEESTNKNRGYKYKESYHIPKYLPIVKSIDL